MVSNNCGWFFEKRVVFFIFVFIFVFTLGSLNLHAQKSDAKNRQKLDFDAVDVEGEAKRPDGSYILRRSDENFGAVYKTKVNMTRELKKSVFFLR